MLYQQTVSTLCSCASSVRRDDHHGDLKGPGGNVEKEELRILCYLTFLDKS